MFFPASQTATYKEPLVMNVMFVDHEFIETIGISKYLEGRGILGGRFKRSAREHLF